MSKIPEIPYLDLKAQYQSIKEDIDNAVHRVIDNCSFILGPEAKEFEKEFSQYSGLKETAVCSNGTDAIVLAMEALGMGPGDEVITTPFTWISTAETIHRIGAKVVFADISLEDFNIDPQEIEKKITSKTKAILPVHLYGQPARMPEIHSIAESHQLKVIEDSAQAHGAKIAGTPIGFHSDAATFSFYPGKNLGAFGDAGAVSTQKPEVAEKVRKLRDHGRESKGMFSFMGHCHRMDGIQAAVLRAKLPHLEKWTQLRQKWASLYRELLGDLEGKLVLPKYFSKAESVAHLFVIRHPQREKLQEGLKELGVPSLVHYPKALHQQKCFSFLNHQDGDFPQAEKAANEVLSIPCYPELGEEKVNYIADSIRKVVTPIS